MNQIPKLLPRSAEILIVLIAISIACSTSKSAGSQAQLTDNRPVSESSTPVATSAVPQSSACTLKTSDAPVINGLKLGMTVEEILALFPGSKEDAELRSALSVQTGRFGNSTFPITPSKYASAAGYKGISRLSFSLLDGRVSNFTINYNGPEWPHVDNFIEKFGKGKNLPPPDQWDPYTGMDTEMKTLTCNGFSIRVFRGGEGGSMNYVLVQDIEADKKLKERRKKAREQSGPRD